MLAEAQGLASQANAQNYPTNIRSMFVETEDEGRPDTPWQTELAETGWWSKLRRDLEQAQRTTTLDDEADAAHRRAKRGRALLDESQKKGSGTPGVISDWCAASTEVSAPVPVSAAPSGPPGPPGQRGGVAPAGGPRPVGSEGAQMKESSSRR